MRIAGKKSNLVWLLCSAESKDGRDTSTLKQDEVFEMGFRRRICFTEKQKAEIWDRWQRGGSMSSIGRLFDRNTEFCQRNRLYAAI
ncbi:hypothetical protein [Ovoidimarina sediminis]|uniref:hypothetical protein n=1 Tax=Ovoidimarina sediminis TaxID=3079856 RepID=UPI00290FD6DE|nr:hypothetical protein [Rhodophyticola sp. MJ-SS7]MDU8944303.1 hypothetical protein [Rhodophyticola sp. MJ-SS7]